MDGALTTALIVVVVLIVLWLGWSWWQCFGLAAAIHIGVVVVISVILTLVFAIAWLAGRIGLSDHWAKAVAEWQRKSREADAEAVKTDIARRRRALEAMTCDVSHRPVDFKDVDRSTKTFGQRIRLRRDAAKIKRVFGRGVCRPHQLEH